MTQIIQNRIESISGDIEPLMSLAERLALQTQKRLTPIRRHVYRCLLESQFPLGAYEILEMMDGVGAREPSTVYRALEWLLDLGLIRKVASFSKYVALPSGQSLEPVVLVLCRNCGRVDVVDVANSVSDIVSAVTSSGYSQIEATFEIIGQCR